MKTKTYGLQNETRQYLRRLYSYGRELAGTDIADIDDFVKGLKQLGLWGNTVCWPMRSMHNMGTGSMVLSLGGGGKFDGTTFNSPTWGDIGMSFVTSPNQSMTADIRPSTLSGSFLVTKKQSGGVGGWQTFSNYPYVGGSQALWVPYANSVMLDYPPSTRISVGAGIIAESFNTLSGFFTDRRGAIYRDTTILGSGSNPTNARYTNCILIRNYNAVAPYIHTFANLIYINNFVEFSVGNLTNLIKTTIGKGLGLP
jgi:hypothetical protein